MDSKDVHIAYFLGIGGIGMSAIARWFNAQGIKVMGYDKTPTTLTSELQNEGIEIHFDDNVALVEALKLGKENTLVVLTPAIPKDHQEWAYFKEKDFTIMKRSQVLGLLTKNNFTIAVAGTHGKTTTSSMVAHVLKYAGLPINAFLGGITVNYNSNLIIGEKDAPVVVEADEFDRSFLTLYPSIAVVTSTDADHLDIYGEHQELKKTFNAFIQQIKSNGNLFYQEKLELDLPTNVTCQSYAGYATGTHHVENLRAVDGISVFDYVSSFYGLKIKDISLWIPGFHNVENAAAAISVGLAMGLSPESIKDAIQSFKGVKRRFEYIIKNDKTVFIDDYAHHPTEISAFLKSVKALYPERHLTAIFQPHLYSRTRDFIEGFADSLALADTLVLMDIYPARELPIPGITSEVLFEKIKLKNKHLATKATLMQVFDSLSDKSLVVTVGAGDIDTFVGKIKLVLEEK